VFKPVSTQSGRAETVRTDVRSGRICSNPARGLGLPRPGKRDYVFLTHGQFRALATKAGRWHLLVLVLGYTGLRWGEATALRVCDIDFTRRTTTLDLYGHLYPATWTATPHASMMRPGWLMRPDEEDDDPGSEEPAS
jgi:integrase